MAAVCLVGMLSGCNTTGSDQRDLAARLETLAGVTSVKYRLTASIAHLPTHAMTVIVEPELTEPEARLIARETCRPVIEVDTITVTTHEDLLASRAVVSSQSGFDTSSCFAEDELVAFTVAAAAMRDLGPDFDGRFSVWLAGPDSATPGALGVRTFDRARLVDALLALADRYDGPVDFTGRWAENGDEYLPTLPELTARITGSVDLEVVAPIIERAHALGAGDIALDGSTITVRSVSGTEPGAADELSDLAANAGVSLNFTDQPIPAN